jgi:hypothetical protein
VSETTSEQWSQLAGAIAGNPGAPAFPAVAELHRRAGRFLEFETVVRAGLERCPESHEGRLVLAIGLLDQGRINEARAEFDHLTAVILAEHGLTPQAPDDEVSESEFEAAFDAAETDNDALIDPNRIAEEAVESVDRAAREGLPEGDALAAGSAFATESMATLLSEQGDFAGAERIRESLSLSSESVASDGNDRKTTWIATLERWLSNIRGESR